MGNDELPMGCVGEGLPTLIGSRNLLGNRLTLDILSQPTSLDFGAALGNRGFKTIIPSLAGVAGENQLTMGVGFKKKIPFISRDGLGERRVG